MARVKIGQINTYVPTVECDRKTGIWKMTRSGETVKEEVAKFLRRAGWKIPQTLHGFALNLDGSNWKFQSGLWERAKAIKDEFGGQSGVRIYASPEVTWLNEDEQWAEIHEAVVLGVDALKESLKGSLKALEKRYEEMDPTDADGMIVDRVNDATNRLKKLSFVIASFALSDDFREAEKGVATVIEAQLVDARRALGKEILKKESA